MAKDYSKAFYKSKEWQACRTSYISHRREIDGGQCERCKRRLGYILHHKIHLSPDNINDSSITLNWCNLEYICKECHDLEHFEELNGVRKKPACIFNDKGEPISIRDEDRG